MDKQSGHAMYEYIQGTLIEVTPQHAVIEAYGVAYLLHTPVSVLASNQPIGKPCLLYCQLIIRENDHKIFGFLTKRDRDLFNLCSSISGVGPKTSLNIIGHFDHKSLYQLALTNNVSLLTRVPGVGKKTAERILLELQHKLKQLPPPTDQAHPHMQDGLSALLRLGYTEQQAYQTIENILMKHKEIELPELITKALSDLHKA